MRKDWDFVDFKDYQSDMDDLVSQATAVIERARSEKDEMLRMLIAAAISQDRPLVIHHGALLNVPDYDLRITRNDCEDTIEISVRPKQVHT